MKKNKLTQQRVLDYLVAFGIMHSSHLFLLRLPYFQFIKVLLLIVIVAFYIPKLSKTWMSVFFVFAIVAVRAQSGFLSDSYLTILHATVSVMLMSLIVLIPTEKKINIYTAIKMLLVVIVSAGLFFHIIRSLGISLGRPLFTYIQKESGRQFLVFPTQVYSIYKGRVDYFRFQSVFNEPGTLGFVVLFVLAAEDFKLKRYSNMALFLSGILSLSMSFYMLSAIYISLKYVSISSFKDNTFRIAVVLFILIVAILLFPPVQNFLNNRFVFVEDEGFQDRRANLNYLAEYWNKLGELPPFKLLVGGAFEEAEYLGGDIGHVSWVQFVYRMGVLISLLWFIFCILFSLRNKGNWAFVLVFFLLINHRPHAVEPFHFLLLSIALVVKSIDVATAQTNDLNNLMHYNDFSIRERLHVHL